MGMPQAVMSPFSSVQGTYLTTISGELGRLIGEYKLEDDVLGEGISGFKGHGD